MVKLESKHRLRRDVHFFASSNDLRRGTRASANNRAYGRAFSSARNRADNRAEHCSPADILTGPLVGADTIPIIFQLLVHGAYPITTPLDGN